MRNKSLVILILGLSVALSAGCRKRVPDLSGKTEAEALAALQEAKLELGDVTPAKGAPGVVSDQEPKAGERLPTDKKVSILLKPAAAADSKDTKKTDTTPPPPGQVAVPPLTDMTVDQARTALAALQLALGEQSVMQNPGTAGTIFEQNPFAGSNVETGTSVNVKIRATTLVAVPEVGGHPQAQAEQMLRDAGLAVGAIEPRIADSASVQVGSVIESNPSAKTQILEKTPVKLVVRQQSVTVPPVRDKTRDAARLALFDKGLVPATGCVVNASKVGLVVEQSPLENIAVAKGSTVFITIGAASRCLSFAWQAESVGGLRMILNSSATSGASSIMRGGKIK